jgi:ABC-2 type transport system ATP-binding protein
MITVEHLTYEYPETRALDDVSFSIQKGTITALVGPNGAGKTTLLQCLAALVEPLHGRILIDGTEILRTPYKVQSMLGYLPDFFGLYERLSVQQALRYFAMAQNVKKTTITARIEVVLSQLDLIEKANAKIESLSRGMRQRLAIGQAMIHDPRILLLDEPASGLDPAARNRLAELFLALNAEGKTLIVSSHILAELDQYANNLLILKNGRLVDQDIAEAETTRKIHIELLAADARLETFLSQTPSAQHFDMAVNDKAEADPCHVVIDFSGSDKDQQALLEQIIGQGIKVKAFYPQKTSVQSQYLEIMDKDQAK